MLRNIIVNINQMNYLTITPGPQNSSLKSLTLAQLNQISQTSSILQVIRVALSTDFSRFASLINAKIILDELMGQRTEPSSDPVPPRSQSQPVLREKPVKPPAPKPVQKCQTNKAASAPKQLKPKTTPAPAPPAPTTPAPDKKDKKPFPEKLPSPKLKKKIHKIVEVKKENPGRVPRVSMIETAEMGKCGLGEKEKRKLKERLLMRQRNPSEIVVICEPYSERSSVRLKP